MIGLYLTGHQHVWDEVYHQVTLQTAAFITTQGCQRGQEPAHHICGCAAYCCSLFLSIPVIFMLQILHSTTNIITVTCSPPKHTAYLK